MAKSKSKAVIIGADGKGVDDHRFAAGKWPIEIEVSAEHADTWMHYLTAECARRGWGVGGIAQMEPRENSGSQTVSVKQDEAIIVVWERRRTGKALAAGVLKIKARHEAATPSVDAREFLANVTKRCEAQAKETVHCRGHLEYDGLAWLGELWLQTDLRLAPPSQQDGRALIGPRVVLVDAYANGVDHFDALEHFNVRLRELSAFLSVIGRREFRLPKAGQRAWTQEVINGQLALTPRSIGYQEITPVTPEMPVKGGFKELPLMAVQRPDFSELAIRGGENELSMPVDIIQLWEEFNALPPESRTQFLQVATLWKLSLSLDRDNQTTAFSLMVASCEALKPSGNRYFEHNIYHVVEALLGAREAKLLQEQWFRPQDVRNVHLHTGEFRGSEFSRRGMMWGTGFYDPTFDRAHRILAKLVPAAIVEWLRRKGVLDLPPLPRRRSWRWWLRQYALVWILAALVAGFCIGLYK